MSGIFQNVLTLAEESLGLGPPLVLRDYHHAAKTFRPNAYALSPKFKFLFHTYFNINPGVSQEPAFYNQQPANNNNNSGQSKTDQGNPSQNYGLLVKEIRLPSFTIKADTLNQYNRKRLVQTKIHYEPVEITFHDDNVSLVTQLWDDYYQYYYNDSNQIPQILNNGGPNGGNPSSDYNARNIYAQSSEIVKANQWGFSGGQTGAGPSKIPFFKNVTVFGFSQHRFTAYTFINPIITAFSHDSYNYYEGAGIMQNKMTIDYETVVYDYGYIDGKTPGEIVTGFGDKQNYDTTPSPIMKRNANSLALGPNGLIGANGGLVQGAISTLAGALQQQSAVKATILSPPTSASIGGALNTLNAQSIRNAPINRNTPFSVPIAQATPGPLGLAGAPVIGGFSPVAPINTAGITTQAGSGLQFNASATSQSMGIAQDPTLNQQQALVPGNPTQVSINNPAAQQQQAAYATGSLAAAPNPASTAIASQTQAPINQVYTAPGSQNTGSLTGNALLNG